jgi:hypothetical protein
MIMTTKVKIAIGGLLAALMWSSSASSALPPAAQSWLELRVAHDAAVAAGFQGRIDKIERLDDGTMRVWQQQCFVPVTLERIPRPPGDRRVGGVPRYKTTVGKRQCVTPK